jgi:hypothetical protein
MSRMAGNSSTVKSASSIRALLYLFYAIPVLFILGLGGYFAYNRLSGGLPIREIFARPFATVSLAGLTANLFTQGGALRASGNDVFIEFRDARGNLANVGAVTFELGLSMPGTVMHSIGKVMPTATPGRYRTTIQPMLAGTWTAKITIAGPRGDAAASLPVTVMP